MSRVHILIEYRVDADGIDVPRAIHTIQAPSVTARGGYPQAISIDAFNRAETRRMFVGNTFERNPKAPRYFIRVSFADLQRDMAFEKRCGLTYLQNAESHGYTSVWDFYQAIGYDYKRKRYVES